jgi:O-succinylbenzoic acid--CoA ligase
VTRVSLLRPSDDPAVAIRQLSAWLAEPDPDPLLIETSGSTGRPKGVVLDRSAVLASVEASARRLGASGRWLLALPSSYVAGVQVVVRSLVAGHDPVVVDGLDLAGAARHVVDDVPAFTSLVPTQLHRVLDDPVQLEALTRCHTVLVGGGGIDPALRRRAEDAGVRVVTTYGSSETAGGCVYDGMPLDGVGVTIATDGRVRLAGPTLFSHYLDDPALTAETLVDGWFLTSDAGRLDEDGRLRVLGRLDDVVISGGVKVPLPAVARRLREHPFVEEAEVLGVPDDEWGQRLVAVVVGNAPPDAELRDWVSEVHPRSWSPREFRRVAALPLLPNGKVDRQALRSL